MSPWLVFFLLPLPGLSSYLQTLRPPHPRTPPCVREHTHTHTHSLTHSLTLAHRLAVEIDQEGHCAKHMNGPIVPGLSSQSQPVRH